MSKEQKFWDWYDKKLTEKAKHDVTNLQRMAWGDNPTPYEDEEVSDILNRLDYHKGAKHGFQLGVLYTCCIMAVVMIIFAVLW
jgi:hypothetical protein